VIGDSQERLVRPFPGDWLVTLDDLGDDHTDGRRGNGCNLHRHAEVMGPVPERVVKPSSLPVKSRPLILKSWNAWWAVSAPESMSASVTGDVLVGDDIGCRSDGMIEYKPGL